ncbi:MAG TPA: CpXC domain-containing protein [Anaerolineaceae bacterium]|nr:CpXC domain-containing protein [Anaerolineaceae bacterium]
MARTSVPCPNCKTPITVDLIRLFDTNTNPNAKQILLSGQANYYQCPSCRSQGIYPTPIVYHDPEKELLLSYFPPELGAPVNEQERVIGPLIKKAVDDLPPEKRKAYIFSPRTMLTKELLFETILESDGITPEMLKAQQEQLAFIQRLLMSSPDALPEILAKDDERVTEAFFILLSRLVQTSLAAGDQQGAQALAMVQSVALEHTTVGKKIAQDSAEAQEVMNKLQELSKEGITREKLLDLAIESAESKVKLTMLVSATRGGMDYQFFQLLTEKAEQAQGDEKARLEGLRDSILELTEEIDKAQKVLYAEAKEMVDSLLEAENLAEVTQQALPSFTQATLEVLNDEFVKAQEAGDEERVKKIVTVLTVFRSANESSVYLELIDILMQAPDDATRDQVLEEAHEGLNDDFFQVLGSLINQVEQSGEQPELLAKLREVNSAAQKFIMRKNFEAASNES